MTHTALGMIAFVPLSDHFLHAIMERLINLIVDALQSRFDWL